MRKQDLLVGEYYARQRRRFQPCSKVLVTALTSERGRVEVQFDGGGAGSVRVPAREILEPWSEYERKDAEQLAARAERERQYEAKVAANLPFAERVAAVVPNALGCFFNEDRLQLLAGGRRDASFSIEDIRALVRAAREGRLTEEP